MCGRVFFFVLPPFFKYIFFVLYNNEEHGRFLVKSRKEVGGEGRGAGKL